MFNPSETIYEILEVVPNKRTRNVIVRRFGLKKGERETLESIGQSYGITRERVRQIEADGLKTLSQPKIVSVLAPNFELIKSHLLEHGSLRREQKLFDDLLYIYLPDLGAEAKSIDSVKAPEIARHRAAFYLILTLGKPFDRVGETEKFHPVWTIDKKSIDRAQKVIDQIISHLNEQNKVLSLEELTELIKTKLKNISDKAIHSYIDASKHIENNNFGNFGLAHWPEISPRGVKDKAYIVLKKVGHPLHFSKITDLINELVPDDKKAYVQTVHNELIKDSRFVLVGRGLYALSDWGYEAGTVSDIITKIIGEEGPQTKDEVIKKVMERRLVKENTILINLQNRKYFVRNKEGRYSLSR